MTRSSAESSDAGEKPLRDRVVEATTEILREQGPSQIKARVVAQAVGASTVAIYHHFGGIPELLAAVIAEGFDHLESRFRAASTLSDEPVAELFAMALCTRELATSNAHLYDLMFGLSSRGSYRPQSAPSPLTNRFARCYAMLVDASRRLVDTGRVGDIGVESVAAELWSAVHGFVTLEAAGQFSSYVDPAGEILRPMCTRIVVGMGVDPSAADHAASTAVAWWLRTRDGTP